VSSDECKRCNNTQRVLCPGPYVDGLRCYGMHMSHDCPDCTGSSKFLRKSEYIIPGRRLSNE
jgi:hypothetical protein